MSEIMEKYKELGGESSFLGKPLHEERVCADGIGRYVTFRKDTDGMISSIHFHPKHGCHETHGAIRAKWEKLGFEAGPLGYPTSDERRGWLPTANDPICISEFEYGKIVFPNFSLLTERIISYEAMAFDSSDNPIDPPKGLTDKLREAIRKLLILRM